MMSNKILRLLVVITLFCSGNIWAQSYQEMIANGSYSVFEIQKKAEAHFEKVGEGKGTGYKQFKRWEYNALREMDENGYLADPYTYYEAHQRFQRNYREKLKQEGRAIQGGNTNGNWTELGPTYKNGTSGWNPGVGRITSIAVDENNYNHIIIGANTGGVFKTTDKGQTWKPLTDDFSTMIVNSLVIDPKNSSVYYWGASGGSIYKSIDAGATWSKIGSAGSSNINRLLIHPTNTDIIFASGQYGGFYKSTNAGNSWTKVSSSTSGYDIQFKPGDPNTVYASGNGFYKSTDGGNSFSKIASGSSSVSMIGVSDDDPNRVYILEASGGKFGGFYKSTNSGSSFTKINHGTKNYFGYSTNADDTRGQAPRDMAITVNPMDADEVHIAGILTWRSLDAGTSFTATSDWVPSRTVSKDIGYCHADVDIMVFYGSTLYVGTDGGFYIAENTKNLSKDYFEDLTVGVGARQFYKIGVSQSDPAVISGGSQDNGTSVMKGGTWYDWLGADGMESFVDWNNPNNLYGTSQNGSLYKSTNGGQSYNGITKPAGNGNWVTPFEQDPQVAATIYSGYSQVYKSTNSGGSWTSISQDFGGNLNQMKIAKSNNKIMLASRGSTLYKTTTGSGNWSTLSGFAGSINYIAIHPSDPNKIALATTGSGKVYVSTNGGSTWTSYLKNLPSMTAYCVVWDDNVTNGLYVGMNYGIYYIDDVLAEWEPFMAGIPNVKVNELEINFVNKKLYAGTYGRGLWISDLYNANVSENDAAITSIVEPSFDQLCGYTEKTISPIVEIKNLGNDILSSAQIKVELNGNVVETFTYTGNLTFGKTEQVTLSELTLLEGTNTLKFYTLNPNGKTDENPDNDAQQATVKITNGVDYQVRIKNDAFPDQITWQVKNDEGIIVGELTDNVGVNSYEESFKNVCLVNDCYTFTISDSGGDGMKIWIESEYEVTKVEDGTSVVYGKGNEFTTSKSHDFCVSNVVLDYNVAITDLTNLPTSQCGGGISPKITLKNLGAIELTTVDFNIEVNGVVVKTINHTTSLSKGESEEVTLDLNLTTSGANAITITAVNPNGKTDEETSNNAKNGQATITIGTPHEFYIAERSMNNQIFWLLTDASGKIIESGGENNVIVKGDLAVTEMCLANGCYDLKVTDAFSAGGCTVQTWKQNTEYCGGIQVEHNGIIYESEWCNKNEPGAAQWNGWKEIGVCDVVYDEDYYGFREVGSTENLAYTKLKDYTSPQTDNVCVGDQSITVDFSADITTGTQCEDVTFTANVTGIATSYEWNFGDGQTASGIGPHTISYQTIGTKTISLTVNGTEVETKIAYISVDENQSILPTINVELTNGQNPGCEMEELTFEPNETNVETGATYKWFLNGNEIAQTKVFIYTQFQGGDKLTVEVKTSASCLTNVQVTSNEYLVERFQNVTPTIAIKTQDLPACEDNLITFTTEVTNEGNQPIYTWFAGNKEIGTGSQLETKVLKDDDEVTCQLTSNAICATDTFVTSNVIVAQIEVCTGMISEELSNINVYPNPTNSRLNIDLSSLSGEKVKWTLYNTYGQIIHTGVKTVSEEFVHSIDMSTLTTSTYFLKIETNNNSSVIKVEKK